MLCNIKLYYVIICQFYITKIKTHDMKVQKYSIPYPNRIETSNDFPMVNPIFQKLNPIQSSLNLTRKYKTQPIYQNT